MVPIIATTFIFCVILPSIGYAGPTGFEVPKPSEDIGGSQPGIPPNFERHPALQTLHDQVPPLDIDAFRTDLATRLGKHVLEDHRPLVLDDLVTTVRSLTGQPASWTHDQFDEFNFLLDWTVSKIRPLNTIEGLKELKYEDEASLYSQVTVGLDEMVEKRLLSYLCDPHTLYPAKTLRKLIYLNREDSGQVTDETIERLRDSMRRPFRLSSGLSLGSYILSQRMITHTYRQWLLDRVSGLQGLSEQQVKHVQAFITGKISATGLEETINKIIPLRTSSVRLSELPQTLEEKLKAAKENPEKTRFSSKDFASATDYERPPDYYDHHMFSSLRLDKDDYPTFLWKFADRANEKLEKRPVLIVLQSSLIRPLSVFVDSDHLSRALTDGGAQFQLEHIEDVGKLKEKWRLDILDQYQHIKWIIVMRPALQSKADPTNPSTTIFYKEALQNLKNVMTDMTDLDQIKARMKFVMQRANLEQAKRDKGAGRYNEVDGEEEADGVEADGEKAEHFKNTLAGWGFHLDLAKTDYEEAKSQHTGLSFSANE